MKNIKLIYSKNSTLKTKISICIPTFNRHNTYLKDSIESVLNQSSSMPIELIVCDNSTPSDNFILYLDRILSSNKRIKLLYFIQNSNVGMYANWNSCIELSNSNWITILNDDDLLDQSWLKNASDFLNKGRQNELAYFKISFFGDKYKKSKYSLLNLFLNIRFLFSNISRLNLYDIFNRTMVGGSLGVIFNKKSAIEINKFNVGFLHPCSDYDFFSSYVIIYGGYYINQPGGKYRYEANETFKKGVQEKFVIGSSKIRRNIIDGVALPSLIKKSLYFGNILHTYLSFKLYESSVENFRIPGIKKTEFFSVSHIPLVILKVILKIIYLPMFFVK